MAWLTKEQEALTLLMSNISEEAYCASWMEDLEFVLWYAVLHGPIRYGRALIDEQSVQQLKQLSEQTGSWILFDDETWETPVSLAEWDALFNSVDPVRYLKYARQL